MGNIITQIRNNKYVIRKIFPFLYICTLGFIFSMQSSQNLWIKNGNPGTDSSVFQTVAMLMSEGLMPYRDIFDHKGPLLYIVNWLAMQISYWRGLWVVELITLTGTFWALYKTARIFCKNKHACLTVLLVSTPLFQYFQGGNLTEEYAMLFIALALFIFSDYFVNKRINCFRLFLCGFSFGAVMLLRANMVSLWLVFCIAVFIETFLQHEIGKIWSFLLYFVLGAAAIMCPILIWLACNHAIIDFWYDYVVFNQIYMSDRGRTEFIDLYHSFSYFFNNILMLMSITALIAFCREKRSLYHFSYIVYFFSTLFLIGISGRVYGHYGMVLIPVLCYPIAIFLDAAERNAKTTSAITIYLVAVLALPAWIYGMDRAVECYAGRRNVERTDVTGKVVSLVENISGEDDQIAVWGNWNIIYVLSHRKPASRYSYLFPIADIDKEIYTEYFEELEKNTPKCIIIQPDTDLGRMKEFLEKHPEYQCASIIDDAIVYELQR